MWAIIGEFDNFSQILEVLNILLDQFMDCNAIIDHYTHMAVHKLDQNCIQTLKFNENFLHMPPLDSNDGGHCFFFQFWPPGVLAWFPKKFVIGGGVKGGILGGILGGMNGKP